MRTNRERGGALLIVLWLSAALGAIALSVATTVRSEAEHASTASEGLRAHYLATGALERAVQWLFWGPSVRDGQGKPRFWDPRNPRMVMTFPSGNAIVEMIPETAKLNVNFAPAADLLAVVKAVSGDDNKAREITEGILHWRQGGAASPLDGFYSGLGSTFRPRRASLEEIEELLSVRGITPELFYGNYIAGEQGQLYPRGGLRDCLSVWGSIGPFDVNGASPALLEALGVNPADVQRIVAQRAQRPFLDMNEVRGMGVTNPRLRVGGNSMWTLRATARLRRPDGTPSEVIRSSSATVKYWSDQMRHPTPVQIVRYYEDAWSEFSIKPGGAQK